MMTYSNCEPTTLLHIDVCRSVAAKNGILILNLPPILFYCKYVPLTSPVSLRKVEEF